MPCLVQLLPPKIREEVERKFGMGEKDYAKVMDDILNYSVEQRVVRTGGPTAMDVDALGDGQAAPEPEPAAPTTPDAERGVLKNYTAELESKLYNYEGDAALEYIGKAGGKKGKGGKKGGGKKGGWWHQPWGKEGEGKG